MGKQEILGSAESPAFFRSRRRLFYDCLERLMGFPKL
jgi:hypothetical protein